MFFKRNILKDFHDFHKFSIGDTVIVQWDGYDKLERVATIKSVCINFRDEELGNPDYYRHNNKVIYYFKEFDGWLGEDKIIKKL